MEINQSTINPDTFRSGFVTLVGRPSSGKSTLLNALMGKKLAIASPTAQTTRHRFRAVHTTEDHQMVIVDTPGVHKPHDALGEELNTTALKSLDGIDVAAFLLDASAPFGRGDEWVISELAKNKVPKILVLSKIDLVDDELLDLRAKLRLDAYFLQAFEHRENEAGAGIAFNGVGALDGMAAVVGHGLELDADLVAQPVEVFDGFIGDVAGEFRMSKTAAGLDDVCVEEVGRVLDAFGLLHVGAGSCNRAAVDDGVAAGEGHLFENEDLIRLHAALMRFERSSEAGKARADDHEFLGFIPLDGLAAFGSGGHGNHAGKAERGGTGSAEELAAGNISHLYFSFEDRNGCPAAAGRSRDRLKRSPGSLDSAAVSWVLTSL